MRRETSVFEAQIRDTTAHDSNTAESESGITVVVDDDHDKPVTGFDTFVVYVEDSHDVAFDLTVESTAADDADYSGAVVEQTITLAAGDDQAKLTLDHIGRIRYGFATGSLTTAPTSGSCRLTLHALGRE